MLACSGQNIGDGYGITHPALAIGSSQSKFTFLLRLHDCITVDVTYPSPVLVRTLQMFRQRASSFEWGGHGAFERQREALRREFVRLTKNDREQVEAMTFGFLDSCLHMPDYQDTSRQTAVQCLRRFRRCTMTLACNRHIAYVILVGRDRPEDQEIEDALAIATRSNAPGLIDRRTILNENQRHRSP